MNISSPILQVSARSQGRGLTFVHVEIVLLITITLLAAGLRFYRLGEWSFWEDEVFTVNGRADGFNFSLWRSSFSGTAIRTAMEFFGVNEWSARLFPAVVGVLTIPLLYLPIRRIAGTGTALTGMLLLSVSPWHLYWSQNARFYALLLLLYSLALLTAYIGFEEDRPGYLVLSVTLVALAARERLLALFFVPVVLGYLVLVQLPAFSRPRGLRMRNLAIFTVPGLAVAFFFAGPYVANFDGWMDGFGDANSSSVWIIASVLYYVGLPLAATGFVGGLYLAAQGNRLALLCLLGAGVPILILAVIAPFHYTASRYAFVALASWIILAALTVHELARHLRGRPRILAAAFLLALVVAPLADTALYFQYQNGNRDNWRAAFEYVQAHRRPGDVVVAADADVGTHYLGSRASGLVDFDPDRWELSHPIWFVVNRSGEDRYPEQVAWIRQHAQEMAEFDVYFHARRFTMRVYRYTPEEPPQPDTDTAAWRAPSRRGASQPTIRNLWSIRG